MTIATGHGTCDGCPGGAIGDRAMVPVGWPAFEEWETVPMLDGPDTHLCPRCQLKRDRGWLQHDLVIECARCGRNSIDHGTAITQWWTLPDGGSTCDDCHDPETDVTRI